MASKKADELLVEHLNIAPGRLDRLVGEILGKPVDDGDLYFEHTIAQVVALEKGRIEYSSRGISHGVGVRVIAGDRFGFAPSNDVTIKRLREAGKEAAYIATRTAGNASVPVLRKRDAGQNLYPVCVQLIDVPLDEHVRLLRLVDEECRRDPRIKEVSARLAVEDKKVCIVSRDGWVVTDDRPLIVLRIQCVAARGDERALGSAGGGGRQELQYFFECDDEKEGVPHWMHFARVAVRQAVVNLSAVDAPAGPTQVVLANGWPGILLHEAIGHGLECDFNRKKLSAFSGRIGQRVASELCTVVDDGTIPGRRGSLNVDDEGTPTRRTVLIEKGVLRGYLQDKLNAKLMGMPLTGNGRRESYAFSPMPRMTNTFMLAGETPPEEIIRSVKRGIYAVSFGGGQVDITNGKFVFSMSEASLIEDGQITKPVKGATLIGNGPDILTKVSMVGDDLKLDSGTGRCGKNGQEVPVGVGLPTIKVDEITVGGMDAMKGGQTI